MSQVSVARIYDGPFDKDAHVVLVDRVWPRGFSKEKADWDQWCKDVAPSTALRKEFHADGDFAAFAKAYRAELEHEPAASALEALRHDDHLLLVTAAKDLEHCQVTVLAQLLSD